MNPSRQSSGVPTEFFRSLLEEAPQLSPVSVPSSHDKLNEMKRLKTTSPLLRRREASVVSPTGFSKGGTDPLGFRIDVILLVA